MTPRPDIAKPRYGGAVLVTLTATAVRLALQPLIEFEFPFITYFAAVFVSAWWLGLKPTLLTVLLSAFLTNLLFLSPTGSDLLGNIGLALFAGIGVGTAYMGEGRLEAQRRAESAAAAAQHLQAVAEDEAARAEEETTRADEESARAQSGNRFFVLSRDLLCALGFDGYFKDLNPAWETTLGYTRAELLAKPLLEFIHPDDRLATATQAEKLATGSDLAAFENRYRCKDGSYRSLLWSATSVVAEERIYGAGRDITERKVGEKQVEEERKTFDSALQQKNVELEDASRLKSEFLANMSHELRTPLNSIIGFSEVLRDGLVGEMTGQQRGFMGDIFSSGNHLLSLINDILDLSKVEAGRMTLDLEPLQVASLCLNSLTIIREKAAAGGIRLHTDAAEELGAIHLDARKVKQIVYNLLSNAVKFSIAGGQVTLRAVRVPRADVGRPSSSWSGRSLPLADNEFTDFLKISVTDTGIGISPADMEHLFKPFSQIDSGLARKFEGTGLGLVMVKLLAELHGGAVAVESAVGAGSCFTVWLPLRTSEEGPLALPDEQHVPCIQSLSGERTALVVEGDFKSAELIRVQLEAEGFKVLHAASAEAALVLAAQQPLALITLDIMLPNMDGWEFLGRIKRLPALRRVPVVIISIAAERNKGFSLGAAAVLEKPISRQALYESLVDLGLFPLSRGRTLKVLVVDDDPKAVELIAGGIEDLASVVLRAHGGREAIETARRELPDVMVIDLMMPDVTGFDVVEALKKDPDTARIPILVVTAKRITGKDRTRLNGYVTTIMEKAAFEGDRFIAEVRRAMSGRPAAA